MKDFFLRPLCIRLPRRELPAISDTITLSGTQGSRMKHQKAIAVGLTMAVLFLGFAVCSLNLGKNQSPLIGAFFHAPLRQAIMPLTPWKSVGGCGASSGSTASDMQIKWLGQGITGALIDMEVGFSQSQSFDTTGVAFPYVGAGGVRISTSAMLTSLTWHPGVYHLKLTIPLVLKTAFLDNINYVIGALGDLSLDVNRKWGQAGAFGTALAFTFPTGRSDILKGGGNTLLYLPPYLQLGGGVYGASARLTYDIDHDWGMMSFGGSYSAGLFAVITEEYRLDSAIGFSPGTPVPEKKSFKFSRSGWGSLNDQGAVSPDNISLFADAQIKVPSLVHGFSLSLSAPLRKGVRQESSLIPEIWYSDSATAAIYLPTREAAQQYADRDTSLKNSPRVVGTTSTSDGHHLWVVKNNTLIELQNFPGFSLQYSVEKSDVIFPIILGTILRYEFDKGVKFAGFAAGVGFKFPVY